MNNLAAALNELLKSKGLNQTAAAQRSGLQRSQWSRWLDGMPMTDEDFTKVQKTIAENTQEQAQLVYARMLDAKSGPGAELVNLSIRNAPARDGARGAEVKLPPKLEEAMRRIRPAILKDRLLRDIILSLDSYLARQEANSSKTQFRSMKVHVRGEKFSTPAAPPQK